MSTIKQNGFTFVQKHLAQKVEMHGKVQLFGLYLEKKVKMVLV
jgi:hypothetical protein